MVQKNWQPTADLAGPRIDADWVAGLTGASVHDRIEMAKRVMRYDFDRPKRPSLSDRPSADEARKYADLLETYELEKAEHDRAEGERREHNLKVEAAIVEYIKREAGLDSVPEKYRAKVWAKAWDEGHANGHGEVYGCLVSLVDIFS